jgi:hypothetical protein
MNKTIRKGAREDTAPRRKNIVRRQVNIAAARAGERTYFRR